MYRLWTITIYASELLSLFICQVSPIEKTYPTYFHLLTSDFPALILLVHIFLRGFQPHLDASSFWSNCCPWGIQALVHSTIMRQVHYLEKYTVDTYKYRHVVLPPDVSKILLKNQTISESEWHTIGKQQSCRKVYYDIHHRRPQVLKAVLGPFVVYHNFKDLVHPIKMMWIHQRNTLMKFFKYLFMNVEGAFSQIQIHYQIQESVMKAA